MIDGHNLVIFESRSTWTFSLDLPCSWALLGNESVPSGSCQSLNIIICTFGEISILVEFIFTLVIFPHNILHLHLISLKLVIIIFHKLLRLLLTLTSFLTLSQSTVKHPVAYNIENPFVFRSQMQKSLLKFIERQPYKIFFFYHFVLGQIFEHQNHLFRVHYYRWHLKFMKKISPSVVNNLVVVFFVCQGVVSMSNQKIVHPSKIGLIAFEYLLYLSTVQQIA